SDYGHRGMNRSELLALLDEFDIRPTKGRGQNFLWGEGNFRRIAGCVPPGYDLAVEIGTGHGGLTEVLAGIVPRVVSFDVDERLYRLAQKRLAGLDNVELRLLDFMDADPGEFLGKNAVVVGNLPYNVASRIVVNLVPYGFPMLFLMQKEVGDRLTAEKSTSGYGFFSAYTGYFYHVRRMFVLGPQEFFPAPKIQSSLLRFSSLGRDHSCADGFRIFLKEAFACRRKKMVNNFSGLSREALEKAMAEASISVGVRAQELSPEALYLLFTESGRIMAGD
ncbi:MAG: rRNA adenine dimethyltransferase family protein, partial [Candidatus Wallbacteria bacterium]|nr:rRNA adenine dimethyltransferase family protein [Candidatus Wallbacteria bacterium]